MLLFIVKMRNFDELEDTLFFHPLKDVDCLLLSMYLMLIIDFHLQF